MISQKHVLNYGGTILITGLLVLSGCKGREKPVASAPSGGEPKSGTELVTPAAAVSVDPEAVVVSVFGKNFKQGELDARIDRILESQGVSGLPPAQLATVRARLRQEIVNGFVAQTVLAHEADRLQVEVSPEAVTGRLDEIVKQLPQGSDLTALLAAAGMTEDRLREEIRQDLRIRKLLEEKVSAEPISDKDAEDFYNTSKAQFEVPETVHARHILMQCSPDATEEARAGKLKAAQDARQKLVDGADFATLAGEISDCPSRSRGGDLGNLTRGATVKEFEDAAFAQATNEIGPVVKTSFGYHIIQVLTHESAQTKPFDSVRDDIRKYLADRSRQQGVTRYVTNLVKSADVTYGNL
jgi:peptidyl-prolyl cis-trans isomerase C